MYKIIKPKSNNDKLVLCVNHTNLQRKNEVQKDIKFEHLLKDCIYCGLSEVPDKYVPLDMGITIRDKNSNKVLFKETEHTKRTFLYLTDIEPTSHEGYDLIMFLSAVGIISLTEKIGSPNPLINDIMAKSIFDVSGLVWLQNNTEKDCLIFNPMIMTLVLVDSELFNKLLPSGWSFVELDEIRKKSGMIKCVLDDLVDINFGGVENE